MGGTNSNQESQLTQSKEQMLSSLVPYEEIMSPHFGRIKIFKQNKQPFKYIMRYRQNGINDESTIKRMQKKLQWYQSLKQNANVVTVQEVRLIKKAQMCIQKVSLQLFTKYYNYNLKMAIETKLIRNKRFKEGDIFFILQSLLYVWSFLNDMTELKYFNFFNLQNIFVSPEGSIKMYPFPIDLECMRSPIKNSQKIQHGYTRSLLQNQELVMQMSPKTSENTSRIGTPVKKAKISVNQRDNIKDIGLVLFQLVLLNKECEDIQSFSIQKQLQLLQQLQSKQFISKSLKQILITLLTQYKQVKSQQICAMIQNYKNQPDKIISTTLRLQDGPEFLEPKEIQKSFNLRKLSEHKHLKVGSISILSKQKSQRKCQQ